MTKKLIALVVATLLLSACISIPHGKPIDMTAAEGVKVGSTKKNEIIAKFGEPPVRSNVQGYEMWRYEHTLEKGNPLSGTIGHDRTFLTLTFNGEVVATCTIAQSSTSKVSAAITDTHDCGKGGR